jgi:hypothetical protein
MATKTVHEALPYLQTESLSQNNKHCLDLLPIVVNWKFLTSVSKRPVLI